MLNILVLLRILLSYDIEADIIKKIIIEWDKKCMIPYENAMNACFTHICDPILLDNGGTRWERHTDFYHRGWQQKKANGKYRWKKKKWQWWHQNPSEWAPYYKLLPSQEQQLQKHNNGFNIRSDSRNFRKGYFWVTFR